MIGVVNLRALASTSLVALLVVTGCSSSSDKPKASNPYCDALKTFEVEKAVGVPISGTDNLENHPGTFRCYWLFADGTGRRLEFDGALPALVALRGRKITASSTTAQIFNAVR